MSAQIDEQAARWHLAQADDDMDWQAFTDWLEADPLHREAFDAIALLDERIDVARPTLVRLLPEEPAPVRRLPRFAVPAAVAATLIGVVTFGFTRPTTAPENPSIAFAAPIGQARTVQLADGSVATLAPGSVLKVPGDRGSPMILEGRAYFDVRHDAVHPMVIKAADYEVRDIGTRFDVSVASGTIRVAVAEGSVAIKTTTTTVEIGRGEALIAQGDGEYEIVGARPAAIGAWQQGPLNYDAVPLELVVADITRETGQPVRIHRKVGQRRFSGVIAKGNRAAMVAALAELAGLQARMDGDAVWLDGSAGR